MSIVLRDLLWVICLCYLDDIDRLRKVGLKAKPSKCELFRTEIKFLGHLVSADGINPMPDKLEAIRDWPVPHCLKDVRAFFGLASYYRRFVKGLATIAEPLTRLTRKMARLEWTEEAQLSFEALNKVLVEATSLAFPVPRKHYPRYRRLRRCGRGSVVPEN